MRRNEKTEIVELAVGDKLGPPFLPNWSGAPIEITAVGDGNEVNWPGTDEVIKVSIGTQSRTDHTGYPLNTGSAEEDEAKRKELDEQVGMIMPNGERSVIGSWPRA